MAARDIQRWADEASGVEDWLREVLRDAAHETPSPAQLDKLVAGVDSALRAPPTASAASSSWIAVGCASALLLAAGAWLLRGHDATVPQPSAAVAPGPPLQPATEHTPEPAAAATPAEPSPPVAQPPAATAPKHTPRPRPAPVATPNPPADPALEVLLLRDAKRALVPAPARARQLLLEHQQKYPQGAFVEEREALMIELLVRQGDTRQATVRAGEFRKRFHGSAYQRRLDDLLQTETR